MLSKFDGSEIGINWKNYNFFGIRVEMTLRKNFCIKTYTFQYESFRCIKNDPAKTICFGVL